MKKLAKKGNEELLDLFFQSGGRVSKEGFVPGGAHEARLSLTILGGCAEGRALLDDMQEKFDAGKVSKRGILKENSN